MRLLVILLGTALYMSAVWCDESEVLVEAGSRAVLPCVTGSPHQIPVTVHWVKIIGRNQNTVWRIEQSGLEFRGVGLAQRARCPRKEFGKGDFSLHIAEVRAEDGGEYICRVGGRGVQKRIVLRVIQVSFTPALPLEGSSVNVACNVTPWPQGASVSWKLNGSPLSPQQKQRSSINMKEQQIMSMSPLEMGYWTCTIRLSRKEGNATQSLSMRGIASPLRDLTQVYAAVGSTVVLPCVYTKGLTPQNTGWQRKQNTANSFKDLPPTLQSSTLSSSPKWDRSLRVERVEEGDAGVYRCFGEVVGKRLQRQLLLVTAKVQSMTPIKPNAPVTLTCDLSNDTGVTGYEWVRVTYDFNGTQTVAQKHQAKALKIEKMTEEHSGEWACRYRGKQGILGNVTYHLQVMSRLEGLKTEGSSGKAPMVTGLCFLFLVLLLIGLQMYKNHRRRKMVLQYPALETIVHSTSNAQERREWNRMREKEQIPQTEI
ncbi:hypothetical protein AAFF_G00071010 [Aldrovandia affinis]|uniref:Ig-like domain-containing protein n=1 Tax=Aldrovandia affinis TaxID=143900 RepID=A0AAD7RYT4_9TELE|nr:hypothetical protein AAFF_G00071010 [Aldrovandia affinis]